MSDYIKFKVVQNRQTKKVCLEMFHKIGDGDHDWVGIEKFADISILELKELRDYLNNIFDQTAKK